MDLVYFTSTIPNHESILFEANLNGHVDQSMLMRMFGTAIMAMASKKVKDKEFSNLQLSRVF